MVIIDFKIDYSISILRLYYHFVQILAYLHETSFDLTNINTRVQASTDVHDDIGLQNLTIYVKKTMYISFINPMYYWTCIISVHENITITII